MTSINSTSTSLGTEPITPPPGVKLDTPEKEQIYRASLEFERFFVQQMLKPMEEAGKMLGGDDEADKTGSTSGYADMAKDQMTQAVLDGGGLGLAATLYGQMADALGLAGDTKTAAATSAAKAATAKTGEAA